VLWRFDHAHGLWQDRRTMASVSGKGYSVTERGVWTTQ
jgi:hypothetical protein